MRAYLYQYVLRVVLLFDIDVQEVVGEWGGGGGVFFFFKQKTAYEI